jgi:cell division septation protein DedD
VATSETELFKDKIEVSLDGRQIFYLFFGGAVIATLVFVLGVMVGRQVESRSVAETGSPTTDPLAALDRLESGSDLAFPAALRGDDVSLGAVDATLGSRKKAMAVGGPMPVAPEAAPEAVEPKPEPVAKPEPEPAKPVKEEKAEKEKKAEKEEKAEEPEAAKREKAEPAPKSKRRRFTLQVGSFQDKAEADTFFRELASTSYDPYMVEADVPGKGKYFRVRVGGYGSFEEAVAAKTEFEEKQRVIAYVTRLK